MSIFTKVLKNDAIYWERIPGVDTEDGQPGYKAPVAVKCRWDDVTEEIVKPEGRTVISKAALMMDRDVVEGSLIKKGLMDVDTPIKPPPDGAGAHEIILKKTYGNIKQTKFIRLVWV